MLRKLAMAAVCVWCMVAVNAQTFTTPNGTWKLVPYAANIIKAIYTPNGYTTNELISDAVIAQPNATAWKAATSLRNDTLYIANKLAITATQASGYRGFSIRLQPGEKIFGGGERALPLNRRGYRFNLYNNPWYGYSEGADNLNYSVPFFTSSNGYALFFDNASKGYADIGKTSSNAFEAGFISGELNVYILLGDYKTILASYYQLTGTQPLPPVWAMGNLMSRFGYTSEQQVTDILNKMDSADVPVDAVIFDLFWFGDSIKQTMGNLDWVNKTKWPDPAEMMGGFESKRINPILITEPFVVKQSVNYDSSRPFHATDSVGNPYLIKDFYFGEAGLIDIFRKDAQQWFWSKHQPQIAMGVKGWWGDLGEPEKHPADIYHNLGDLGFKRLFKADEVHNLYGHTWTKMLYNFYAKEYPEQRLFTLNRSGFAGSQRYGILPWTGDVSRSWSGLRAQLPLLLGMSMSGVPYVHSDAGGFAGGEGDNELYVRWLQFAAFTPIFRPHGTALGEVDKNAFSFPSEVALIDTPYRQYAKNAVALRYAFLPYNYTLAYLQTTKGQPLMAPLYYHYPNDTTAASIQDVYMWGENMLVAPVLQKDVQQRSVYLPKGRWYGPGDSLYNGGKHIEVTAGIADIPYFIKAGSFVPMVNPQEIINTSELAYTERYTVVYLPGDTASSYTLYHDDGLGKNNLTTGNYSLTHFKSVPAKGGYTITVYQTGKDKSLQQVNLFLLKGDKLRYYTINGKKLPLRGAINVPLSEKPVTIQLSR